MIENDLSSISEVILYNLVITTSSLPLHTYMYTYVYNLVITTGSPPVNLTLLIYYG